MKMKNRVVNYKGYVISTEEGEEKGIFFRSPLQKIFFDAYYGDDPKSSAWLYKNNIKNPIRRFYESLIGNRDIVKNINDWSKDIDWAGFSGNILCLPIYFKRKYRKLTAYSCNSENITRVESYGYESQFNSCSGDCHIEKTKIYLSNGKSIKIKRKEDFYFTYEHIIKDIIDTGKI